MMPTWSIVSLSMLLCVVVRWGVSLNSYSGRLCVERGSAGDESQQSLQVLLLSCLYFQLFNANEINFFFSLNVSLSRSWEATHVWWLWSPKALARGDIQHPRSGMVRTDALPCNVLAFYLCPWTKNKVSAPKAVNMRVKNLTHKGTTKEQLTV